MLPSSKTYRCIGFFTNGKPCRNNSKVGMYCNLHVPTKKALLNNINIDMSKIFIQNHLSSQGPVNANIKEILGECLICNDPVYCDNDAKLKCKHYYHFDCVCNFRKAQCPSCRRSLESPLVNCNLLEIINDRTMADEKAYDNERFEDFMRDEFADFEDPEVFEELEQTIIQQEHFLQFLLGLHQQFYH